LRSVNAHIIKDDRNVKNISIKVSNGNQCFYELRCFITSIRYIESDQAIGTGSDFQSNKRGQVSVWPLIDMPFDFSMQKGGGRP